jgi:hypothetical protein
VCRLKQVEKRILKHPKKKKGSSLSPLIRKARSPLKAGRRQSKNRPLQSAHPFINLLFGVLLEVVWEEEPVE